MTLWILTGVIILLISILAFSIFFNVKHGILILRITDAIEESITILDERVESISKILEIDLFYDSPEIRRVLQDVRATRDSILYIANELTTVEGYEEPPPEGISEIKVDKES